jgi:hypothetical protein
MMTFSCANELNIVLPTRRPGWGANSDEFSRDDHERRRVLYDLLSRQGLAIMTAVAAPAIFSLSNSRGLRKNV